MSESNTKSNITQIYQEWLVTAQSADRTKLLLASFSVMSEGPTWKSTSTMLVDKIDELNWGAIRDLQVTKVLEIIQ